MRLDKSKPLREQTDYQSASERFHAYYQVLKLTLSQMSLEILDEMLKERDAMETLQNQYWYNKGLTKAEKEGDRR